MNVEIDFEGEIDSERGTHGAEERDRFLREMMKLLADGTVAQGTLRVEVDGQVRTLSISEGEDTRPNIHG